MITIDKYSLFVKRRDARGGQMKLDKAIEILSSDNRDNFTASEIRTAEKIGADAIKRVKAKRLHFEVDINRLLTGETREGK